MSKFITKRRLASLASASAMIATMAVAAVPAATLAASPSAPRPGSSATATNLTAAQIGGTVTGELDATGCDIGVYNPTSVTNANIHGAQLLRRRRQRREPSTRPAARSTTSASSPFDGMQHGRAILYINGATGTISGNKVYDFQKNGIEVSGLAADGSAPSSDKTSATVAKNVVTGGVTSTTSPRTASWSWAARTPP